MRESDAKRSAAVRSNCPECDAGLKVLSIISGRAGSEYWTMRCTKCGGIHLDIVKGSSPPPASPSPSPSPAA
jgi:Zn finger protein HypA/HybF involved in hydrogenase expression